MLNSPQTINFSYKYKYAYGSNYSDKDINTINHGIHKVKKVIQIINISIFKTINTRTYIHSSQVKGMSYM